MKSKSTISALLLGAALAIAALMSLPAGAGAHATVTPFQPQTSPLTAARTLYVLRVPNEQASKSTYKVTLYVPAPLQEVISVKQHRDWTVKLRRKDTGKMNEGAKRLRDRDDHVDGEEGRGRSSPGSSATSSSAGRTRWQPGKFCFPVNQYYRARASTG